MGLDVYVGTLTRYYSRNWETRVQQYGRDTGTKVVVLGRQGPIEPVRDRDEIANITSVVLAWRDCVNQALQQEVSTLLDWEEQAGGPYFTEKPAWDCYGSLLLWAAYAEHPELTRPTEAPAEWCDDPAFHASHEEGFRSRYSQLLHDVEWWFPLEFDFTFRTEDPTGKVAGMGSSAVLLRQLDELNGQTWGASQGELDQWSRYAPEKGSPLEAGARFAFGIFRTLAEHSVRERLPMKLDY